MARIEPRAPLILLTNDDGFFSEGIEILHHQLKGLARTVIVAPDREKSATSLSLTLHRPLRVKKIRPSVYAVDGTPADCIYLAIEKILPRKPELIISGLNHGPNLGQQDISYSGTVAAAFQGTFLGIPSMAISVMADQKRNFHFEFAASIARQIAEIFFARKFPREMTLNINIPPPPVEGLKITKLGQKRYNPEIIEKKDPRDNSYYWIGAGAPKPIGGKDSDVAAVLEGFISVTPLHTDLTDYVALRRPALKNLLGKVRL